ncbi:PREDICTED: fatty acid-binding protein 1, liver-like [Nanorana parkeri]|uniref:fatty acid-binding protein 1, liver-like n=1 Tax=Nanorana parkeri TaxID=125878 RepID=UPI00085467F2|nr:PREDICTED: fatty acid-binding protein 1, liver-like [Nanorana parkeri]
MAFSGTYELQSHENFESFMKAIGIPDDAIQKCKDLKTITEIVQNGNHFVITMTTGPSVLRNEFTVGEEAELESVTGKMKSVVNFVDGKLVVQLQDIQSVTELSGELLICTLTCKGNVYKTVNKKRPWNSKLPLV